MREADMAGSKGSVAVAPVCGCGTGAHVGPGGKALAVDPAATDANLKRLRRIEGQVRGLQKMVEEKRYCADILTQVASVHEALRAVSRELMRNHLKHCASEAIRSEDPQRSEQMYEELLELVFRSTK